MAFSELDESDFRNIDLPIEDLAFPKGLTDLSLGTAKQRIARLFLYLIDVAPGPVCHFFHRDEVAAILGVTTESASRTVAKLKREKAIHQFAAQWLGVGRMLQQDLGIRLDREKVNHNGSGIALGHPVGSTGLRIVVTLYHEMERTGATPRRSRAVRRRRTGDVFVVDPGGRMKTDDTGLHWKSARRGVRRARNEESNP